jgi:predicted deacylase
MQTEQIALASPAPGVALALTVHRFGTPGARPRVYIQASLHADELPGMIAAHHLRERLTRLEAEGRIAGEIVLVPSANPIGLSQTPISCPRSRKRCATGSAPTRTGTAARSAKRSRPHSPPLRPCHPPSS